MDPYADYYHDHVVIKKVYIHIIIIIVRHKFSFQKKTSRVHPEELVIKSWSQRPQLECLVDLQHVT